RSLLARTPTPPSCTLSLHDALPISHKTLRGPRGGLVLCAQELAEFVDRGCPLVLGGPLPHVMAAKAVALAEASQPSFPEYAAKRSEEHTSELQSPDHLVCRLLLEKK